MPELVGENPKPCLSIPRCFRSCIRGRSGSSPRVWSEQRSSDTVFSASTGQAASLVCDQPGAHLLRAYAHQHHRDALSRRVASRSNTPAGPTPQSQQPAQLLGGLHTFGNPSRSRARVSPSCAVGRFTLLAKGRPERRSCATPAPTGRPRARPATRTADRPHITWPSLNYLRGRRDRQDPGGWRRGWLASCR